MKITLNNRETELIDHEKINIKELLRLMKYTFPMIIIKKNGKLVKKDNYNKTFIRNGDKVEAIHLISGG